MRALTVAVLLLSLEALAAEAPRPERKRSSPRIHVCGPLIIAKKRHPDAIELLERKALPTAPLLQPPETFRPR